MKKSEIVRALGLRLREIRRQMAMKQKDFAAAMGVSPTYLSDIEAGRTGPGFYFFYRSTKHLDINPLYLLHGKKPVFIKEMAEKKEEESRPEPERWDFGENKARVEEMLSYIERSPLVKFDILSYFSELIIEKQEIIASDIRNQQQKS